MGRVFKALQHSWNGFTDQKALGIQTTFGGTGSSYGIGTVPYNTRIRVTNERSIVGAVYSRLAVDVAVADFKHVRVDPASGKYVEDMKSGLNNCLTVEPNIDQTPDAFLRDFALTLFDKGVACLVPIDTTTDPSTPGSWDINTMRVGEVAAWHPRAVTMWVYNDAPMKGIREQITLPKSQVAIIENPFYSVMNSPNSTLQRLIRKLNMLDAVDEASSSGKLDMIIQLPYVVRGETKRAQANQRRQDIADQLRDSQYGIAYADGTEKITQLNRPATNNLMDQISYLVAMLYDQMGLTNEIMNGTADEKTMLNYNSRTIAPILNAAKQEMARKFLTNTGRSQGQTIMFFRNPFELMPLTEMSELADVLSRNEIITPNEFRMAIGFKPSSDPNADQLNNSNMPDQGAGANAAPGTPPTDPNAPADPSADPAGGSGSDDANAALDQVSAALDKEFEKFGLSDEPDDGEEDPSDEEEGGDGGDSKKSS